MLTKTRVSVTSSDNTLDNTNPSKQNNLKEDTNQKKHCDEKLQKVIQGEYISQYTQRYFYGNVTDRR